MKTFFLTLALICTFGSVAHAADAHDAAVKAHHAADKAVTEADKAKAAASKAAADAARAGTAAKDDHGHFYDTHKERRKDEGKK